MNYWQNPKKPASIAMAKKFNIIVNQKFTRKEIDIVCELNEFCRAAKIKGKHYYFVKNETCNYFIDYYLPDYKIAIEIDEFNHSDRNPVYEKNREKYIKNKLGCVFIRCNPDDPEFNISSLIGQIHRMILKKIN